MSASPTSMPALEKMLPPPARPYLLPSIFWGIREPIPFWMGLGLSFLTLLVPFLLWSGLSYSGLVKPLFLPTPTDVIQSVGTMFTEKDLLLDIAVSSMRVGLGFLAAALIGVPLGIAMGTFRSMESLISPIVGTVRYMPVTAFIPLVILWVGLGEEAKVVIIFLGIVFYNIIMVADAVKFIPEEMLNVSYTLGAGRWGVLTQVILPAAFPSVLDTLRVNVAGAWNFLVIAELVASDSGLGYRILKAQRFLQTSEIFVGIIIIGIIGLLLDFGFKLIASWVTPWADQSKR